MGKPTLAQRRALALRIAAGAHEADLLAEGISAKHIRYAAPLLSFEAIVRAAKCGGLSPQTAAAALEAQYREDIRQWHKRETPMGLRLELLEPQ